jgi:hypothetical protein
MARCFGYVRQPRSDQHLHGILRLLVLREREIGNWFGGAADAVIFRILYQAYDLVQLLGARRGVLTPEARSNRICAQPELFGD